MVLSIIDIKGRVITIDMPSAQIMSHVVKEDSVVLMDEHSGLFNRISTIDYPNFMIERKIVMEEKANTSGLLQQAQINAQKQIKAFLLCLPSISEEYEIRFK